MLKFMTVLSHAPFHTYGDLDGYLDSKTLSPALEFGQSEPYYHSTPLNRLGTVFDRLY